MGEGPTPTGMAGTAADPGADPETLRQIAFHYPDLRPVVAANPAAYQGLLDWLAALGDPRVDAALASRNHSSQGGPAANGGAASVAPAAATSASLGYGATPAQGVPNGGDRGAREAGPGKGAKIALIVLLVAALVLVAVVWAIFRGASGGSESDQPSATPGATSTTDTGSASPTPTETSSGEVRYPAPDGAVAATSIVAPSGNIACDLQPDAVTCSIVEQAYVQNGLQDCDGQSFALLANADTAERACGSEIAGTGTQLPYGTAAVNGNSVCLSDTKGMSCWNTVSGQSFALARQGWQTGNTGTIEPADFLW